MSRANVELVRESYEAFRDAGEFQQQFVTEDFVWDMSNFRGWPEQQVYDGPDGARSFLGEWIDTWEDWTFQLEALHEAGEKVIAVMHQSGRSKASGLAVDMRLAQVWTVRDGKLSRMDMYSDPADALEGLGLKR